MIIRKFIGMILIISFSSCAKDKPVTPKPPNPADSVALTDKVLTDQLSLPWELVWGPDNFIWMTEKRGVISRVDPATGIASPVFTIADVEVSSEGGLLGMVLHPQFESTPQVFVAYNYSNSGDYQEKIVRYTYNGTTLTDPQVLLDNLSGGNIHNGCRLAISEDLKLYISTGDAADDTNAQDTGRLNGKILRINLDGSIPDDNPYPSSAIWSFGHRNPQGLVFAVGKLYSSEHGPDTDDEINIIGKGANYGWPTVRGFCDKPEESDFCAQNEVTEPIKAWTPTIAPSGIDYYNAEGIPQFKNSLLVAILKGSKLLQLKLSEDGSSIVQENEFLSDKYGRLRDICISPQGNIYVCTSNGSDDKIIELTGVIN